MNDITPKRMTAEELEREWSFAVTLPRDPIDDSVMRLLAHSAWLEERYDRLHGEHIAFAERQIRYNWGLKP